MGPESELEFCVPDPCPDPDEGKDKKKKGKGGGGGGGWFGKAVKAAGSLFTLEREQADMPVFVEFGAGTGLDEQWEDTVSFLSLAREEKDEKKKFGWNQINKA